MIVSKSSWHYRLYATVQGFHFGSKAKTQPDLCSYVTTLSVGLLFMGVMIGLYAFIWVAIQPFRFLNWVFFGTDRRENMTMRFMIGVLAVSVFAIASIVLTMATVDVLGMPHTDASINQLIPRVTLSLAAFIGMIVGLVWLRGKRKQKQITGTTPFVTLAVTGIKDKWNGTFCRTINLVD